MSLPGQHLLALARAVVDAATLTRVIEPAIADLQHEWSAGTDLPIVARTRLRTRAYAAALLVVASRVAAACVRGGLTPPPWAIVRQVIVPSIVMLVAAAGFKVFLQTPRENVAYEILFHMAWIPFLWPAMLQRQTLEWARIPAVRASDLARLTAFWCLLCLGTGEVFSAAGEPHRRLILVAITPIAGVMAWIALRPRRALPQSPLAAHLVRGMVLAIAAIAISMAFERVAGRIASAWIGIIVAATGALLILQAFRLADRYPNEPVERDA